MKSNPKRRSIYLIILKIIFVCIVFLTSGIFSYFLVMQTQVPILLSFRNRLFVAIGIPIAATSFYYLRCINRLVYGGLELSVGIITIIKLAFPSIDNNGVDFNFIFSSLAGIYIVIRGLDNIETGLKNKLVRDKKSYADKIFALENNEKWYVYKHFLYLGENYYYAMKLNEKGDDFLDDIAYFRGDLIDGEQYISLEEDPEVLAKLKWLKRIYFYESFICT